MEQMSKALEELSREYNKQKEEPRDDNIANRLRNSAALVASDAVRYMRDSLRDKALEMARAVADFCDEYEKAE